MDFTHINQEGRAKMVDVSEKLETKREAVAAGSVFMKPETLQKIQDGCIKKGDVLAAAQVGGIMAAKNTAGLIPMCHPIFISGCDISFTLDLENSAMHITATVSTTGQTGVEMEALTAVSVTALTIYDMCKSLDREMLISDIRLLKKTGGKSGVFERCEG